MASMCRAITHEREPLASDNDEHKMDLIEETMPPATPTDPRPSVTACVHSVTDIWTTSYQRQRERKHTAPHRSTSCWLLSTGHQSHHRSRANSRLGTAARCLHIFLVETDQRLAYHFRFRFGSEFYIFYHHHRPLDRLV